MQSEAEFRQRNAEHPAQEQDNKESEQSLPDMVDINGQETAIRVERAQGLDNGPRKQPGDFAYQAGQGKKSETKDNNFSDSLPGLAFHRNLLLFSLDNFNDGIGSRGMT
jgi:hypothetical protein